MSGMRDFNVKINEYTEWMNNEYVSGAAIVFLILYSGALAPRLPEKFIKLFNSMPAKFGLIAFTAFMFNRNATVAIVLAIAFMITIIMAENLKIKENLSVVGKNGLVKDLGDDCEIVCRYADLDILFKTKKGKEIASKIIDKEKNGELLKKEKDTAIAKAISREEDGTLNVAKNQETQVNINLGEDPGQAIADEIIKEAKEDVIKKEIKEEVIKKISKDKQETIKKVADKIIEEKENVEIDIGRPLDMNEVNRLVNKVEVSSELNKIVPFETEGLNCVKCDEKESSFPSIRESDNLIN